MKKGLTITAISLVFISSNAFAKTKVKTVIPNDETHVVSDLDGKQVKEEWWRTFAICSGQLKTIATWQKTDDPNLSEYSAKKSKEFEDFAFKKIMSDRKLTSPKSIDSKVRQQILNSQAEMIELLVEATKKEIAPQYMDFQTDNCMTKKALYDINHTDVPNKE